MPLIANDRYSIAPAPEPLEEVQDFLNTVSAGRMVRGPDLLATVEDANEWFAPVWAAHSGGPFQPLSEADLPPLRQLRDALTGAVSSGAATGTKPRAPAARVELVLDDRGIQLRPVGTGSKWVAALLLAQIHDAEVTGQLRRLKVCPNEWCHVAFYDRSKNNSAVWHDPASCGNLVNVRASRARKRGHYARLDAN